VSDFLEISQVAVKQSRANREEVGMARVVNLNDAPRVLTRAYPAATDLDNILRAYNSERHEATELGVLLDGVLIILLNIVREVIDRDPVVLNVLHHKLL
jgi:hypothetical protein